LDFGVKRFQDIVDIGISAAFRDFQMEYAVGFKRFSAVSVFNTGNTFTGKLPQPVYIIGSRFFCQIPRGQAFQFASYFANVPGFLRADLRDSRVATRIDFYQPVFFQPAQTFPNRRPGNPKSFRYFVFGDAFPAFKFLRQYHSFNMNEHLIGQT
jgi:hypothetical protein